MFLPSRLLRVVLVILVLCFCPGCSQSPHSPEERYFLISTNIQLPYWQAAGAGFSRAASHLKVRAEFTGPNSYDEKAQVAEFQKAVRQKASGILVSPADPALMKPEIDAAIAAPPATGCARQCSGTKNPAASNASTYGSPELARQIAGNHEHR